jgi:outer membrane receptor protein involved in Fe transport
VTKEIGIKGSFWQDKANVNLGVFNIDRQNVALSWNTIVDFNAAEVEDLMNPNDILPGDPRYKYSEEGTASASRYYKSTENSRGADLTLNLRPFRGLQMRFTVARTQVTGEPDLDRFRGYYEAAVKRGNELPALLADAKLLLDTLDIDTKPSGARAAPWSASWVFDYAFQRDTWAPLRGVRLGVNGSWRDDYLLGTPNGQELVGGATHLVHGYLMRDQKVWNQQLRVRLGVRNIIDLENGKLRKTSFTTMNDGSNVYRYSYVVPVQYELNMSVRF